MLFIRHKQLWVICDLDGTLCLSGHRSIYARMKQWDEFHTRLTEDLPRAEVRNLLQMYTAAGYYVALVTGRPYNYLDQTLSWLHSHDIPYNELHMRGENDKRSDIDYKREVYSMHFSQREVRLVLEDRDRVVEMWRALGLLCLQVQKGDY